MNTTTASTWVYQALPARWASLVLGFIGGGKIMDRAVFVPPMLEVARERSPFTK